MNAQESIARAVCFRALADWRGLGSASSSDRSGVSTGSAVVLRLVVGLDGVSFAREIFSVSGAGLVFGLQSVFAANLRLGDLLEIGRASCRERVF